METNISYTQIIKKMILNLFSTPIDVFLYIALIAVSLKAINENIYMIYLPCLAAVLIVGFHTTREYCNIKETISFFSFSITTFARFLYNLAIVIGLIAIYALLCYAGNDIDLKRYIFSAAVYFYCMNFSKASQLGYIKSYNFLSNPLNLAGISLSSKTRLKNINENKKDDETETDDDHIKRETTSAEAVTIGGLAGMLYAFNPTLAIMVMSCILCVYLYGKTATITTENYDEEIKE